MKRKVITTADGSPSFMLEGSAVTYHSNHGAICESSHVFISSGLAAIAAGLQTVHVFEMGLGSGLNAWLTAKYALAHKVKVMYWCVERYPLHREELAAYYEHTFFGDISDKNLMINIHTSEWGTDQLLHPYFSLHKTQGCLQQYTFTHKVNLVYYDAFAPREQPELWTTPIFTFLYNNIQAGGLLVTYCSKSEVRRNMQAARFKVEKIAGPPGKREIVRAFKM